MRENEPGAMNKLRCSSGLVPLGLLPSAVLPVTPIPSQSLCLTAQHLPKILPLISVLLSQPHPLGNYRLALCHYKQNILNSKGFIQTELYRVCSFKELVLQ